MSWLIYNFVFNTSTQACEAPHAVSCRYLSLSLWRLFPCQGTLCCTSFVQTMHRQFTGMCGFQHLSIKHAHFSFKYARIQHNWTQMLWETYQALTYCLKHEQQQVLQRIVTHHTALKISCSVSGFSISVLHADLLHYYVLSGGNDSMGLTGSWF